LQPVKFLGSHFRSAVSSPRPRARHVPTTAVSIFAHPAVASAVFERSHLLVQLLFTPLPAGWWIWMGIAVSSGSTTFVPRGAAYLPPLAIIAVTSLNVITLGLALGTAAGLLAIHGLA
jgi:ABC-2 type transport system permease protein